MADEKSEKGEKAEKAPKAERAEKGEKASGQGRSAAEDVRGPEGRRSSRRPTAVAPRFTEKYKADVIPALTKQFSYKNPMQVPRSRRSSSTWASARP